MTIKEDLFTRWLHENYKAKFYHEMPKNADLKKEVFVYDDKTGGQFRVKIKDIPDGFK